MSKYDAAWQREQREKSRKRDQDRRRDEEQRRHNRAMEEQGRRRERIARGEHPGGNIVVRFMKLVGWGLVILFVVVGMINHK